MSTEATTPTTPTEGSTSSEAAATTLLTSTETAATTPATASETPKEGETPAEVVKTEETKVDGAPEKYEFKAPEGKEYDSAVLEPFSEAAKEANLTQDAAQKLLDKMAPALAERQTAQVKAVQDGWATATATEFGGDKLKDTKVSVSRFMSQFDPLPAGQTSTPLRTLLETTGLGNHPDLVRIFVAAGKAISEDTFVAGKTNPVTTKTAAEILYDNTPK